jgi:signal transduction histidine kinase
VGRYPSPTTKTVLSVANQGVAIAHADMDRIFDLYWRSDQKNEGAHFVLGLHICAQVAEAHQGTRKAMSSARAGTRFEMRWPVNAL